MGVVIVRLFSPMDVHAFVNVIPKTVKAIAVLDRTKEPNGVGEPLYMNVINALNQTDNIIHPKVIGGRYGLSSKEFTRQWWLAFIMSWTKKNLKIISPLVLMMTLPSPA